MSFFKKNKDKIFNEEDLQQAEYKYTSVNDSNFTFIPLDKGLRRGLVGRIPDQLFPVRLEVLTEEMEQGFTDYKILLNECLLFIEEYPQFSSELENLCVKVSLYVSKIYEEAEDLEGCLEISKKISNIYPQNNESKRNFAKSLILNNKKNKAAEVYNNLIKNADRFDSKIWHEAIDLNVAINNLLKAKELLEFAIFRDPKNFDFHSFILLFGIKNKLNPKITLYDYFLFAFISRYIDNIITFGNGIDSDNNEFKQNMIIRSSEIFFQDIGIKIGLDFERMNYARTNKKEDLLYYLDTNEKKWAHNIGIFFATNPDDNNYDKIISDLRIGLNEMNIPQYILDKYLKKVGDKFNYSNLIYVDKSLYPILSLKEITI